MSDTTTTVSTEAAESDVALWLVDRIRFYNQVDPATITLEAPLTDLGLDSIYVMTLCGDIEDTYGLTIDPTFFADFTTLEELADGLAARVAGR